MWVYICFASLQTSPIDLLRLIIQSVAVENRTLIDIYSEQSKFMHDVADLVDLKVFVVYKMINMRIFKKKITKKKKKKKNCYYSKFL